MCHVHVHRIKMIISAPKRGCTFCSVCGESNGNRAVKCKSCGSLMQGKSIKRSRVTLSQEVTSLMVKSGVRAFSCKVRKEGPDYRTFVMEEGGKWTCYHRNCDAAQCVRSRSGTGSNHECEHIKMAHEENPHTSPSSHHLLLSD